MRKHHMKARMSIVAVMALSLAAALLPAVAVAQDQSAQQVPQSEIRVGENEVLRHDDPRPTRGRDAAAVAVNPADPNHIVMANADLFHFTCEYHTSRDGGATWTTGTLTAPPGYGAPAGTPEAPCSPIGHGTSSFMGSHAVSFGSGDNVYVAFASALPGEELAGLVARSTDGGETFSTAVVALPGGVENTNNAFPGVVAHARDGEPDRLVVVAHDGTSPTSETPGPTPRSAVAAVSQDGGETWSDRVRITEEGQEAREVNLAQGPAGELYVSWRSYDAAGELRMARSTDGLTWENVLVTDVFGYFPPEGNPFGSSNFPRNAVGPEGNVYLTWMEGPAPEIVEEASVTPQDHFIHPDADVFLARSTDGGVTWSDPVQVSDEVPSNDGNIWHQTRHPEVSTAPNGRVDVVWQDRRHWYRGCQHTHDVCNEGRFGDTYWAQSTDEGQSFGTDVRVSDRTQNNEIGSDYRQGVYWSYSPVAAPMGNDELFVAWMDSRRGNFETDALDIVYAKASLDASGPIPERAVPAAGPPDLSVAMANHAYPGGSEATLVSTFATEAWTRLVVVNEDDPALATAGAVLARAYMGPLLVTPAGSFPARLQNEAERMDPIGAFVLGGTGAVSDAAVGQMATAADIGSEAVTRFDGTPAEIAAAVAREMDWRGTDLEDQYTRPADGPAFEAVVIVNPDSPEASTAAALAANRRLPVLFVDEGEVPPATASALSDLLIDETLVVGGTTAVSDTVLADLPNPTRLGGTDVAETSRAVAEEALARGLPANVVYVSDAANPMDTAIVGSAAGRVTGLQLATAGASTSAASTALTSLGVVDEVDRFIVRGDLGTRQALTWACPDGAVPGSDFTDVSGNVHELAIECAAWYGITAGGPGGLPATQYGPALQVRRDQMASFIARMIDHAKPGLLPPATGANPFPGDLTETNAHFDAIRRLAAAGIVQGGPGGLPTDQYGPGQSVRRDQMASFIHRAITEVDGEGIVTDASFFDDLGGVHVDNINALASEGIVLGVSDDEYAGGRAVRRDQMASFVNRGLDFLVQHGEAQLPVLTTR